MPAAAAPPPPDPPTRPQEPAPWGGVDAHAHMMASEARFPPAEGRAEDPGPGDLTLWTGRLRRHLATLGCVRAVLVHSIVYGRDNALLLAALDALGPRVARGVGLAGDDVEDAELDRLRAAGVVALRLNYVHGGVLTLDGAVALGSRLADRGMHLEILLHTHRHMDALEAALAKLPTPVVVDHHGWPDVARGPEEPGFQRLLGLLSEGRVWVKLSAAYRLAAAPYDAVAPFARALIAANEAQCVWGSDWPHIMLGDAEPPDAGRLFDAFARVAPDRETRRRILVDAPQRLYGF